MWAIVSESNSSNVSKYVWDDGLSTERCSKKSDAAVDTSPITIESEIFNNAMSSFFNESVTTSGALFWGTVPVKVDWYGLVNSADKLFGTLGTLFVVG